MTQKVALIAGASGVVGSRLAAHLSGMPGWRVIGVARHVPSDGAECAVQWLQLDLRDASACRAGVAGLEGVTHLFNTARYDHDSRTLESPHTNTQMLANILDALVASGQPLEHVHLVHGTKYYGSHLGPFRTPAREDDPRSLQDNFYYHQEDHVIARHAREGWTFSASRPHAIVDRERPAARSVARVIAVYAAISKALGLPLCFPGTPENYRAYYEFTDAALLARAIGWMSTAPAARNQAYNIANGDFIRWCDLWPVVADYFAMALGPVQTVRLADVMADKADVWQRVVAQHRLVATPYDQTALWAYGDFVFTPGWDIMTSTTKARLHGFHDVVDSEAMLLDCFDQLQRSRVVPDC